MSSILSALQAFFEFILDFFRSIFSQDPAGRARSQVLKDVKFVRRLLREAPLAADRRSRLQTQLDRLERRTRGGVLHLAVIGEFNSGKSTFINALLGQRLLKSANIATTASSTELRYGSEMRLSVRFLDGSIETASEHDCSALAAKLQEFLPAQSEPASLRQLINLVTADSAAALAVDTIEILLPSPSLRSGMAILDTPGVGAGPDYAEHHFAVTEKVLAEQADTAIVLIPADGAVSHTLLDFLDAAVRPFLNRCVFVITKMDCVDEGERAGLVELVKAKLTRFLGAAPVVLEAGALAVLTQPDAAAPDKEAARSYWRAEFSKLQELVLDRMSRQGSVIVAENLTRLLHQTIQELRSEIGLRRELVDQQQKALEANSVAAIETVLARVSANVQESINETLKQLSDSIQRATDVFENRSKRRIGDLLECTRWKELKQVFREQIPAVMAEEERAFDETVQAGFAMLDLRCTESHEIFAAEFEKHYRTLKSLGIPQLHTSISALAQARPNTGRFIEKTKFKNGPGIGQWLGFVWDPAKKQQQILAKLYPSLEAHVKLAAAQWRLRLAQAAEAVIAHLQLAVKLHLKQYSKAVKAMIREHERQRAALENEQLAMNEHTLALTQRASRLDALRQNLAAGIEGVRNLDSESSLL